MVPDDLIGFVSPAALVVWCALARFSNKGGVCWPSIDTLAKRCRFTTRHVRRMMDELVKHGRLQVQHRDNETNVYRLLFVAMPDRHVPDDAETIADTGVTEGGTSKSVGGEARVTPSADADVTQTITMEREPTNDIPIGNTASPSAVSSLKDFQEPLPKASPKVDQVQTPATATPEPEKPKVDPKPEKPKKRNWAGEQFPKLKIMCPNIDARAGCIMLNKLAGDYGGQALVDEALIRLDGKGPYTPVYVWGVFKSQLDTIVTERAGLRTGRAEPTAGNSRRQPSGA